jgi:glycosyltransferase involved in cell wall biosynthesis
MNVSVVIPLRDEEANVARLLEVVPASLAGNPRVHDFEILCVDDGSRDQTLTLLRNSAADHVHVLALDRRRGKEVALAAGIDHARYDVIALLDADLQTTPDDLGLLFERLEAGFDCVNGNRIERHDSWLKRVSSRVANRVRRFLLGDSSRDINCPLKVVRAECLRSIPRFRAWHRYIPHLAALGRYRVAEVPVRHFPRTAGRSKYGVRNRLWVGLQSLAIVWWLTRNSITYEIKEHDERR